MDTKEKRPARRQPSRRTASRQRSAAPERRRRPPAASREKAMPQRKTRTVRPPREDIPEVVYTMPKPFRKGTFLLKLVSVVAVVVALVMALSIFFRVDTIQIAGMEKYTPWMVREASGIEEGDSLLGIGKAKVAGRIISKLPYVDRVKVGINLPGTVNIEITELKVTYAIQATDSSWWLITSEGRVVEPIDVTAASGYTRIAGVMIDVPQVDQTVQAGESQEPEETTAETTEATKTTEATENTDASTETETAPQETTATSSNSVNVTGDERLQTALEMIQCLERNEIFGQIASIDVSDTSKLTMEYGKRFHIILGNADRLDYKISYMTQAVKQLPGNDMGELDVSFEFSDEALFTPVG